MAHLSRHVLILISFLVLRSAGATVESDAQKMLRKRDRSGAARLVVQQMYLAKGRERQAELERLLFRIADQFFSERALSDFQQAESHFLRDTRRAQESFKRLLGQEPFNARVVVALADTHLRLGECGELRGVLQPVEDLYPKHPLLSLKRIQELDCLGQDAVLPAEPQVPREREGDLAEYYRVKGLVRKGRLQDSEEALRKLQGKPIEALPEIWRLRWQVEASPQARRRFANRYLEACQNPSDTLLRQYRSVSEFCSDTSIIQRYLKDSEEKRYE
jgi:hypothetical protein